MKSKSGEPLRLLLCDTNQTQCELLSTALRRQPRLNVRSCRETTDCLPNLEAAKTDVLLVGGSVPETSRGTVELVRSVRTSFPQLPIIVLLHASERELVINLLRAGVRGIFCLSSQSFKELRKCIQVVHEGQYWTNTEQMGFAIQELRETPPHVSTLPMSILYTNGNALLTTRENQVVGLIAEGLSNRAAARELKISENSVKKGLLRIYDKLGISNRVELVLYAMSRREPHPTCPTPYPLSPSGPQSGLEPLRVGGSLGR